MFRRRWSASEVNVLLARYEKEGPAQLAVELGRSEDSVSSESHRLRLRSAQRRRKQGLTLARQNRSVNIGFFDNATPEVAYVLGYLWGRATVRLNSRSGLLLRCPIKEVDLLLDVRARMRSTHSVQYRNGHAVCEICSYWLISTLLTNYGSPPSKNHPDPALPHLPAELLVHFVGGLLVAGGKADDSQITWVGRPRAITELQQFIQKATGVAAPETGPQGHRRFISWTTAEDVQAIRRWLRSTDTIFAKEATVA